jgi:hypothetical protein
MEARYIIVSQNSVHLSHTKLPRVPTPSLQLLPDFFLAPSNGGVEVEGRKGVLSVEKISL